MRYREFGRTGWHVSEIGFGAARIGGLLAQDGGRAEAIRTLETARDAGINFFDTADIYGQGESEILIGKAFRKGRDKVFIASKGGYCLPTRGRLVQFVKPLVKPLVRTLGLRRQSLPSGLTAAPTQDFSPVHIRKAVEHSLRRLRSDYIDLYQLHSPPPAEMRLARFSDTVGELERMKREGKIREFGLALDSAEHVRYGLAFTSFASMQLPFGLLDLEALDGVLQSLTMHQMGIIARGCFGGGALKDTLPESDLRQSEPKWERVLALKRIFARHNRPALEMALQFALRARDVSVNIIGMRTTGQLESNLQYYASAPLSEDEYRELLTHAAQSR